MNRETRDKFVSGTDQSDLTTGNSCWETAPAVFAKLDEDFGPFDVDLTADGQRHLCDVWFGPDSSVEEYDTRTAFWPHYGDKGFSNPPYGKFIREMLHHARYMRAAGFESTLLLPLRVTKTFVEHVLGGASELLYCNKRLVFYENGAPRCSADKHGKLRADTALFDSIIVRYIPGQETLRTDVWQVPPHVGPCDLERWGELHGR